MKCSICSKKLAETFLQKQEGTPVKDAKGKVHWVCPECQRQIPSKAEMLKKFS